jgi:hypothetical protein
VYDERGGFNGNVNRYPDSEGGLAMSFFWTIHHAAQAGAARNTARDAKRTATDLQGRVDVLEARCDQALLVAEALWTILRDKLGVSEEELVDRVNDVDLSDGQLDGKVRREAQACPNCNRTIAQRFARCMYCGTPIAQSPFAR